MLPPPGSPLGGLRAQVKKFDRNARALAHDGHLQAAFNEFHASPVLGGAKSAGAVNPNIGR